MGLTNEHVGPKLLAKIKIYVLTRAELLFTLCYEIEIPCNRNEKKDKFIDHPVSACLPAMARVVGKFPSAFHLLFLRRCTMWSKPFWSTLESGINVGFTLINLSTLLKLPRFSKCNSIQA